MCPHSNGGERILSYLLSDTGSTYVPNTMLYETLS